jgi:hypothetical protein
LIAEFERLQYRFERSKETYVINQEALQVIVTGQSLSQKTVSILKGTVESQSVVERRI